MYYKRGFGIVQLFLLLTLPVTSSLLVSANTNPPAVANTPTAGGWSELLMKVAGGRAFEGSSQVFQQGALIPKGTVLQG